MSEPLYLGVDIGGSHISACLMSERGQTCGQQLRRFEVNADLKPSNLIGFIESFKSVFGVEIAAVGIASPGPLDPFRGVIVSPPNLPRIRNLDIVDQLQSKLNCPVFLIHDVDAALLGEHWLGAAVGCPNVVMLTLGTGVGSSVMTSGFIQVGRGMGSEWGHTTLSIPREERVCACGRFNCLEAFAGSRGLLTTYAKLTGANPPESGREALQSEAILNTYCFHLAEGVMNIVNVHHPRCLILGGGLVTAKMVAKLSMYLSRFRRLKLGCLLEGLEIKQAVLPDNTFGAARYAILKTHNLSGIVR